MVHITDRQIAVFAMLASLLAGIISIFALIQTYKQFGIDYEVAVTLSPGVLPIRTIPSDKATELTLTITNTSKTNLKYFIEADSNAVYITGDSARPGLVPNLYHSGLTSLSKPEAGAHTHSHKLSIRAQDGVDMPALAKISDPLFYLSIEVLDASNGRLLAKSNCYYSFDQKSKSLVFYEPKLDTDQKQANLQAECET